MLTDRSGQSPVRQRGESRLARAKERCAMPRGSRPRSPQLAARAFLALLPLLPSCTNSPAPGRPGPAGRVGTTMFTEAEAYERFMGRWSPRLAPPFIAFAGLKDGDRVLDVGSGTGTLALVILQEAP